MSMDIRAQLRVLKDAQGDPAKLALASVDLTYPAAPEAERDALKETLEAAAIPHWCDQAILAALLDLPAAESGVRVERLSRLNEVENFEARGAAAVNVHEAARLALRKRMAREDPARFRALSARAAAYFAPDPARTAQIEWIYHRLSADPDAGAAECEALLRGWVDPAYPEDRDALALVLKELEATGLVEGRARLEVLLVVGENESEHTEFARVAVFAQEALKLAKSLGHATGEARANDLLGQALQSQGRLGEALKTHQEALRIRRELAAENPDDLTQLDVAVAHSRLGDVYEAQSEYGKALAEFLECSRISQVLVDREPGKARWKREASVAHARAGDVLREMGRQNEARIVFETSLGIMKEIAAAEPDNDEWQRDLAIAHLRIGQMFDAEHVDEARQSFQEYLRICQELLSHDSDDARRQWDLAIGHAWMGFLKLFQAHFAEAQVELNEARGMLRQLVARDPNNAQWRSDLASACHDLGLALRPQNLLVEAQSVFGEALELRRDLSARNPESRPSRRDVASELADLATTNNMRGLKAEALSHYEEASRIYAEIVQAAPDNAAWAAERENVDQQLEALRRE